MPKHTPPPRKPTRHPQKPAPHKSKHAASPAPGDPVFAQPTPSPDPATFKDPFSSSAAPSWRTKSASDRVSKR
jgi:hypothetical protein